MVNYYGLAEVLWFYWLRGYLLCLVLEGWKYLLPCLALVVHLWVCPSLCPREKVWGHCSSDIGLPLLRKIVACWLLSLADGAGSVSHHSWSHGFVWLASLTLVADRTWSITITIRGDWSGPMQIRFALIVPHSLRRWPSLRLDGPEICLNLLPSLWRVNMLPHEVISVSISRV